MEAMVIGSCSLVADEAGCELGKEEEGETADCAEGAPMDARVSGCGSLVADGEYCELKGRRGKGKPPTRPALNFVECWINRRSADGRELRIYIIFPVIKIINLKTYNTISFN